MYKEYEKLVRDNIPAIIRAEGKKPVLRILDDGEYRECLNKKLREEVCEYLEDNNLEELCDILEVVEALAYHMGYSDEDVRQIKSEKAKRNGRFKERLYLEGVESRE